jgi:cytoskeletal protein RodZ
MVPGGVSKGRYAAGLAHLWGGRCPGVCRRGGMRRGRHTSGVGGVRGVPEGALTDRYGRESRHAPVTSVSPVTSATHRRGCEEASASGPTVGPVGTGIVFVVLVAIWVAYFVQYWSRRREHLATARSVESFAEAMRVLERRPPLRAPSGPRVSSAYAMSPARVVSARPAPRPQVIAKPHPTTPSPSREGATRMSTPTSPRPAPRRTRAPRPRSTSSPVTGSPSRKVRGLSLLGSLLGALVLAGLAAFSIVPWWAPLVGVTAVGASFLWLRSGVQAEIAARRSTRGRRPAARSAREPAQPSSVSRGVDRARLGADEHEVPAAPSGAAEPELIETASVTATAEGRPDGWQPVPVPPPTYTLKAKAERPTAPAPSPELTPETSPAAAESVAAPAPAAVATAGEPGAERAAAYGT